MSFRQIAAHIEEFIEEIGMPIIKNFSRAKIILEHVTDEPIVLEPSASVEIPAEALSIPLIRHYIEIKKLGLISQRPTITNVTLSR
jgi:hypothetical protein